jgi:hypothetical protein
VLVADQSFTPAVAERLDEYAAVREAAPKERQR